MKITLNDDGTLSASRDLPQEVMAAILDEMNRIRGAEKEAFAKIVADTQEHVSQRGNWTAEDACERIAELLNERTSRPLTP